MLTKEALTSGHWFVEKEYFREWEKYSVVEVTSKVIITTAANKHSAESMVEFINSNKDAPEFFKKKVKRLWKRF